MGRATPTSAPSPQPQFDGWRVVGVVVEDAAGQRLVLPLAGVDFPTVTGTPAPTATAPPTNTPRPAPTVTASATVARTPTPAATPTAPLPDTPTPTQEVTALPPLTPRPTHPPPDQALCMAGVKTSALNVRADPSTAAAIVGRLAQGERVPVDAVFVRYPEGSVNREEWGRLADGRGWIALWHAGSQLAVLDDTPACWEVVVERKDIRSHAMTLKNENRTNKLQLFFRVWRTDSLVELLSFRSISFAPGWLDIKTTVAEGPGHKLPRYQPERQA
jgi:hypothetical protein